MIGRHDSVKNSTIDLQTQFRQAVYQLQPDLTDEAWAYLYSGVKVLTLKPKAFFVEAGQRHHLLGSSTQLAHGVRTVNELLTVVEQRSINLADHAGETALYRRPAWLASLLIRLVLTISPPLKLFLYSFANGGEAQSYCRDVLEEAHRLNTPVPGWKWYICISTNRLPLDSQSTCIYK